MNIQARSRRPPVDLEQLYGEHSWMMVHDAREKRIIEDRAAYIYVTGCFPSHTRPHYTKVLSQITMPWKKASSLDGGSGEVKVREEVAAHMRLEHHALVQTVRGFIQDGYQIRTSYNKGERRNYWRVHLFKQVPGGSEKQVTVQGNGAIKDGWRG